MPHNQPPCCWYHNMVCTHVPHLDLVDFGQNVSTTARLMVSCNSIEKNSNRLMLCPCNPYIPGNMPNFWDGKFFSFWHYIPLDNHWIQLTNPSMRYAAAHQKITSSRFKKKLLITQILKRWLLVAKKVPYKFPNNIASNLLTLHAINWQFVCQPKNAESSRSMQF